MLTLWIWTIFTHGFSISDITICDIGFSDHKSVLFAATFLGGPGVTVLRARCTHHYTVNAAEEFASTYAAVHVPGSNSLPRIQNADKYLLFF